MANGYFLNKLVNRSSSSAVIISRRSPQLYLNNDSLALLGILLLAVVNVSIKGILWIEASSLPVFGLFLL